MTPELWIAELERRLLAAQDEGRKASREKEDAERRLSEANEKWRALGDLLKLARKEAGEQIPY